MMKAIALGAATGLLAVLAQAAPSATDASCDRVCLKGIADQMIDSMVANDPGRLPSPVR